MYLLDENITKDQRELLQKWHFNVKQIGTDIKLKGIKDDQIVTFLQQAKDVLFFTRDSDFFKKEYCHTKYCIVYLDIEKTEVAFFIRRFLNHPSFDSKGRRLGKVIKINQTQLQFWELKSNEIMTVKFVR